MQARAAVHAIAVTRSELNIVQRGTNLSRQCFVAELGSSAVILRAGYSIDCLMTRYQVGSSAAPSIQIQVPETHGTAEVTSPNRW